MLDMTVLDRGIYLWMHVFLPLDCRNLPGHALQDEELARLSILVKSSQIKSNHRGSDDGSLFTTSAKPSFAVESLEIGVDGSGVGVGDLGFRV